ncbi:MAG: acyltransferase family protein [Clostridiales bacterium]|jgi:surface polysaccharide O-acyltransferase-like enzyme|nr:acyltransferase family protein [Clostridiales bacterium]
MTVVESQKTVRETFIDVLKVVSILGIITIHSNVPGLFNSPIGSFSWLTSAFLGSMVRFSVPVFFMCSGALLLDPQKELTIGKIYGKYLLRAFIALFVWASAYEAFDLFRAVYPSGRLELVMIKDALLRVLKFKHHYHLYFLHIMLLFYALLPIARVFVKNASETEYRYLLIFWFLLGIVYPSVRGYYPFSELTGIPAQYGINTTYSALGYGLLGYYIKTHKPEKIWIPRLTYLIGFALTFGCFTVFSIVSGKIAVAFWEGMLPFVFLMAVGLFGAAATRQNKPVPKIIGTVARSTMCVYLVHEFFLMLLKIIGLSSAVFLPLISVPLVTWIVFGISFCVYLLLRKIPWVNRYLI